MTLEFWTALLTVAPALWAPVAVAAFAGRTRSTPWGIAHFVAQLHAAIALAAGGSALWLSGSGGDPGVAVQSVGSILVAFLGWIVVRFSRTYLAGEPGQARYVAALALTLGSVHTVVLAQHLGVLIGAWVTTSLGLHALLTFYPERTSARVVAHKKFILSRVAELCLAMAAGLLWVEYGSLSLSELNAAMTGVGRLPPAAELAMLIVAVAVVLKSAQLPVHGWLIQVMEAPTPVSALLHAGVVNLGGIVLLKLGGALSASPGAQALLIVLGATTAVVAGLVMMTRISIKVRLAWSTCAQMGFLLMECGLGWYDLALLHLVGHSVYKAHAFLASGEVVRASRQTQLRPQTGGYSGRRAIIAHVGTAAAGAAILAASVTMWRAAGVSLEMPVAALFIVALGLATLFGWDRPQGVGGRVRGAVRAFIGAHLYLLWHFVFLTISGPLPPHAGAWAQVWVLAVFGGLFVLQHWTRAFPEGRVAARLYPLAYAGFHLDERVVRVLFRLWPMPSRS